MSRSSWLFTVASVLMGLATATPAAATTVWRGDLETGNLSQFDKQQSMGADRLQVVQSPVHQGSYALRAEVRKGDDPINGSGNRNELVKFDGSSEGSEFYYGWSTLWPSDYPMTPNWQVFMQWHHPGNGGAPPVRFVLGCSAGDCGKPMPDTLFFIVNGKTQWTMAPVTRGVWHQFVLHIKWSADPNVGFVELWYDGQLVVPKRNVRTMFSSSDTNYLKMGLYRDEAIQPTAALYHDGFVQATTLEEAMQAAAGNGGVASQDPGASQGTTPPSSGGQTSSPGTDTGSGVSQGPGTGTNTGTDGSTSSGQPPLGVENSGAQAVAGGGCSSTAASATPWVSLMGVLVLGSLSRFRRRANRRA